MSDIPVRVGESLIHLLRNETTGANSTHYTAMKYNFKPDSVDYCVPGKLAPSQSSVSSSIVGADATNWTMELDRINQTDKHTFAGVQKPNKDVECVLLYDPQTGTFVLEHLDSTMVLSPIRSQPNLALPKILQPPTLLSLPTTTPAPPQPPQPTVAHQHIPSQTMPASATHAQPTSVEASAEDDGMADDFASALEAELEEAVPAMKPVPKPVPKPVAKTAAKSLALPKENKHKPISLSAKAGDESDSGSSSGSGSDDSSSDD